MLSQFRRSSFRKPMMLVKQKLIWRNSKLKNKRYRERPTYQNVPEKVKIEVGRFAAANGTKEAIKRYSKIYPKYNFKRTSVNSWKGKIKTKKESCLAKRSGRHNLLDDHLLKKTKDIIIGTRNAGTVISRRMVIAIGTG